MISCCRFCTERHIGCHSACPRYIKEAESNARRIQSQHEQVEIAYGIRDMKMRLPVGRRIYAAKEW